MPRANRYWVEGAAYHLTHRCHDRDFLFRFARDRDAYRELLRVELQDSPVSLLNYAITSNHVHLLVTSESLGATAKLVQSVHGRFAEKFNQRKRRQGAFWSDRYHATQIDGGEHLWSCLKYIDLNMVRAGVVRHPRDWAWTGWHELTGERKRNRLIDRKALLERLDGVTWSRFESNYREQIDNALGPESARLQRDARWTEAVAVGDAAFVLHVEATLMAQDSRKRLARKAQPDGAWVLREGETSAGLEAQNGPENSPEGNEKLAFSS